METQISLNIHFPVEGAKKESLEKKKLSAQVRNKMMFVTEPLDLLLPLRTNYCFCTYAYNYHSENKADSWIQCFTF